MPEGLTTTIYAAGGSFEKISRSDGSLDIKTYVGGFAIVTARTSGGSTTTSTAYTLTDHLGSIDTITDAAGNLTQKMSFDAWGKRRQVSWANLASPLYFDTSITTRGFTGHEEIDQAGLIHMNGRVYDPELGRFISADPFVQDASNAQSWNRYSYVLNNPLSMTDPTGFFFGSIFNAIGNFVGSVFKAVASILKAALKIPLIRAVIQIAACGSGVVAVCLGVTGAMALAAGGGIGDALQAMAFTAASMGVWGGVGGILHTMEQTLSAANVLITSAVHGVVNGALSMAQGGTFVDGFVSGAIGQAAGMFASADGSALAGIGGDGGKVVRSIFAGAAGGAASELTGGKFMNGFVTAAFAHLWNGEAAVTAAEGVASWRAMQESIGNKVFGTEIPYYAVDAEGRPLTGTKGKLMTSRIDGLSKSFAGYLEGWEIKNGDTTQLRAYQRKMLIYFGDDQVRFFGAKAADIGIKGMSPSQAAIQLRTNGFGGVQLYNGPIFSQRAARQWYNYIRGSRK